ncbi:MAG: hypothetical protein COW24_06120 [Candidatus Kerfeldbacteria bacterium CG15_BIG_FIL_POST_REV_8_21_14_020_45_12]|uniref:Cyclic nucleotide-binding domain-containing protein n=1 Tax=Candidatus Kerfeldbacteria bacterium CG15_BIG_FIL_POST_REV_8_21_14_020_45_12 TaxID=2014247 RepID=A0A2M7H241_9BACT|nr:MAG: hypothetical protein COW24_06120 [Candidatus Kerfeldbacteria bacterium CG15_BIG_FIL_POST_REV_8_21_14_020_45_12]PJA92880.1 MAG: hypothetical protein CO132_05790 [Candidatus Kerfeldbacteria bacterium CG_4_9_14_3_um_filter_45_8]
MSSLDVTLNLLRANPDARAKILQDLPFFRDNLHPDTIKELATECLAEFYARGSKACEARETADTVIVVVSGQLVLEGLISSPEFGQGQVIGTFGLLVGAGQAVRTETLIADDDTLVLEIFYSKLEPHRSSLIFEIGRQVHAAMMSANARIHQLTRELNRARAPAQYGSPRSPE